MKGAQEEIVGLPCLLQPLDQLASPPPKRRAPSRPWENVCCHFGLPRRHPPLSADLSEEDARTGWKQKALLFSTCSCWAPREKLTTDQSRLNAINFLI